VKVRKVGVGRPLKSVEPIDHTGSSMKAAKKKDARNPKKISSPTMKGKTGPLPDPTKSFKSGQRAGSPLVDSRKKP
jgi:hypothetical protein